MKKYVLLLPALLLVWGCGGGAGKSRMVQYYIIEYTSPRLDSLGATGEVLRLEPMTSIPDASGREMVYRSQPFAREAFRYHRWHVPPQEMAQRLLARDIRESGLFRAVLSPEDAGEERYLLTLQVDECLLMEKAGQFQAMLTVPATLLDLTRKERSRGVVLQKTYRQSAPLTSRSPQELARGMSEALELLSRALLQDMAEALKKDR